MLPDISDLYASWQDQHEEEVIPDWAPRSVMQTSAAEESYLTRIEKRLGRVMDYGEAHWALREAKAEEPCRRFVDRVHKCRVCGRWHDKAIECIPF